MRMKSMSRKRKVACQISLYCNLDQKKHYCCTVSSWMSSHGILQTVIRHPVAMKSRKRTVNIYNMSGAAGASFLFHLPAPYTFFFFVVGFPWPQCFDIIYLLAAFCRVKPKPLDTYKEFCSAKVGQLGVSWRDIKLYPSDARMLWLHVKLLIIISHGVIVPPAWQGNLETLFYIVFLNLNLNPL